jgi:transcription elongation factor GreB
MTELSKCITPGGFKLLKGEERELWLEERPRVTREVSAAAALGDRSENAEYQYGKKRLREIDRRLRWLRKRMAEVSIVHPPKQPPSTVGFGAYVTVEDEEGELKTWQLVGTDEFDVKGGKISIASPIARALVGKEIDDEVEVIRPKGPAVFTIIDLRYDEPGETDP